MKKNPQMHTIYIRN